MGTDRRSLKQQYEEAGRTAGVFQIRNVTNEKVFVASGLDLQGILNSHRFQLGHGGHRNKRLQADWNELGPESFVFEVLDRLGPNDLSDAERRRELRELEDMWLEQLQPYGDRGYNEPKKTTAERLRMISENRRGDV